MGKNWFGFRFRHRIKEPHDLLGYLHPNGTFIESETKLVRALMKAKENQNQLYIIVLMK